MVTGSSSASRSAPVVSTSPSAPAEGRGDSRYPSAPPVTYRSHQRPQSGLLTAGDHDDLLNPALYARYVNRFLQAIGLQDLPRVDTSRTLTVAVQDNNGRPIPFAPVRITCADGNSVTLATVADGTAVFFPDLDRLGDRVQVATSGGSGRTVMLEGSGGQRQTITVSRSAAPVRKFDLLVAIDTTGSMGDEIAFLKSELRSILGDLASSHPGLDMRLSLVAYRDQGDDYVTWTLPFTRNSIRCRPCLRDITQLEAEITQRPWTWRFTVR